jgi:hypothetical protein
MARKSVDKEHIHEPVFTNMGNGGETKIQAAKSYLHTIYCIEQMKDGGFAGLYGLEQQRTIQHEKLCEILHVNKIQSKEITFHLDKYIDFDVKELDEFNENSKAFRLGYEYVLEKYAVKLIGELGKLPKI